MVSFVLISVYLTIIVVYILWRIHQKQQLFKLIVTPEEHIPIIGCIHKGLFKSTTEKFEYVVCRAKEIGTTAVLWIFHMPIIFIQDPVHVKAILTSSNCVENTSTFDLFHDIGYTGSLLMAKTKQWFAIRKQFNSSFYPQIIEKTIPNLNEMSTKFVKDYSKLCGKEYIDIFPVNGLRMIETTIRIHLNISIDETTCTKIFNIVQIMIQDWGNLLINYHHYYLWYQLKRFLGWPRRDKMLLYCIRDLIQPLLKEQFKLFDKEFEMDGMETEDELKQRSEVFIKKLRRLFYNKFLSSKIFDLQLVEIIFTGSDTLALSISNTILCLAMNPEIQEKSYQEIVSVTPDLNDEITLEIISKLEYFDRVIKESLRLIPIVPFLGRQTTANVKMGNVNLPTGTNLYIPIFNLHRFKSIWGPNAEVFDPDNFLPENVQKRHRFSYLPFSNGQRNCIAYKYAEFALRIILIRLVKHFKFSTNLKFDDLKFGLGVSIILLNKHMVAIEKRD